MEAEIAEFACEVCGTPVEPSRVLHLNGLVMCPSCASEATAVDDCCAPAKPLRR